MRTMQEDGDGGMEATGKWASDNAEFTPGGPDFGGGTDGSQEEVGNLQLRYRAYLWNMDGQYSFWMEAATILACGAASGLRGVYAFFAWPPSRVGNKRTVSRRTHDT